MFVIMMFMSLTISMLSFTNNPMIMIIIIIMSTMMGSFEMFLNLNLSWIPLITIMLFVGGLMITYIFILSMNSNEKLKNKMNYPFIIPLMLTITLLKMTKKKSNKETGAMFFSNSWLSMYMIISLIIITMIFMTNMIFNPSSPSKSMK